jgi:hypothetical protein
MEREIRRYRAKDLLSIASALQLLPENAACISRLHILAHGVSAGLARGIKRPNREQLDRILNNSDFAVEGGMREDPLDNPFAEEFHYDGIGYSVLPDPARESTYILRHLVKAALGHGGVLIGTSSENRVRAELHALLTLSDEVVGFAGIDFVHEGDDFGAEPRVSITIPTPRDLARLCRAVTFNSSDLVEIFEEAAAQPGVLSAFTFALGDVPLDEGTIEGLPLDTKPFVRVDNLLVVAAPRFILTAARHCIMSACVAEGQLRRLAEAFHDSVWHTLVAHLKHLGFDWQQSGVYVSEPCWSSGIFRFDTDKALYTLLVSDTFEGYDPKSTWPEWETGKTGDILASHMEEAEWSLFSATEDLNEILFLPVLQSVGRPYAIGLEEEHRPLVSPWMIAEASEIESLMFMERGNDLALWYFAKARERLREGSGVSTFSLLDEYLPYTRSKRSFYFSDEARPNLYYFPPGGKGEIRREIQKRWRFHTIIGPSGTGVEVMRNWDTEEIPSVLLRDAIEEGANLPVAMAVEELPIPIWILARDVLEVEGLAPENMAKLHNLGINFVQMICYWVWKLSPYLSGPLADAEVSRVNIRVQVEDVHEWFILSMLEQPDIPPYSVQTSGPDIDVMLRPTYRSLLSTPTNTGERKLMGAILTSLTSVPGVEGSAFKPTAVAAALDEHAQLGKNKRLAMLDTSITPDLDEVGPLAKYRPVQDQPQSDVLDKLGAHLQAQGRQVGPIAKEDRVMLLQKDVVSYLYGELERLVATLQSNGLYEWLIIHYEALTHRNEHFKFEMPMREAGFSDVVDIPKEFQERHRELATARTAARFIVEYVAARPPRGLRPISYSVYDELLAHAKHIVDFAFLRDVIEFGLADVELSMLPSGRLGTNRGQWEEAQAAYLPGFMKSMSRDAASSFERHFERPEQDVGEDPDPTALALSEALHDEFGLSLKELSSLYEFLQDTGDPWNSVHALPKVRLTENLAADMGWDSEKASAALDFLTLEPRADFLKPPTPFKREDVYPWIFGRPLSFIRRPLLLRTDTSESYLYWGSRSLRESYNYLLYKCMTGRIKPRTSGSRMDSFRGSIIEQRGEAFNDEVANLLAAEDDFIVVRRLESVGGKKIQEKGNDLGDIDVLVAVPAEHRIAALECKQFSLARNPRELKNEVEKLFHGTGGKRKKAAAQKHLRRTKWLRKHLADIVRLIDGDQRAKWVVEPAFVTDRPLLAPLLADAPFPVLLASEAVDWLKR